VLCSSKTAWDKQPCFKVWFDAHELAVPSSHGYEVMAGCGGCVATVYAVTLRVALPDARCGAAADDNLTYCATRLGQDQCEYQALSRMTYVITVRSTDVATLTTRAQESAPTYGVLLRTDTQLPSTARFPRVPFPSKIKSIHFHQYL
jgi:hypothetical protein